MRSRPRRSPPARGGRPPRALARSTSHRDRLSPTLRSGSLRYRRRASGIASRSAKSVSSLEAASPDSSTSSRVRGPCGPPSSNPSPIANSARSSSVKAIGPGSIAPITALPQPGPARVSCGVGRGPCARTAWHLLACTTIALWRSRVRSASAPPTRKPSPSVKSPGLDSPATAGAARHASRRSGPHTRSETRRAGPCGFTEPLPRRQETLMPSAAPRPIVEANGRHVRARSTEDGERR